jgi:hypothetical protein
MRDQRAQAASGVAEAWLAMVLRAPFACARLLGCPSRPAVGAQAARQP